MVVAVGAVGVVQVPADEVVDVVAVRNPFVAAAVAVDVIAAVTAAGVIGRACGGVGVVDGDRVLDDEVAIRVVQVALV